MNCVRKINLMVVNINSLVTKLLYFTNFIKIFFIESSSVLKNGGLMLDNYFNYKKHKTDFKTEVIAGVSTFLTMAYIMFLNPVILADGGFDFGGVFTATAIATALACFIAAFYAKTWPVGLAPGMGINAFIAYGVCLGMEYTPAEALGAVFVAGVVFLIISLTPVRAWLINSIPKSLKLGIGAGCLLYTSPSPRDRLLSRMPSSA